MSGAIVASGERVPESPRPFRYPPAVGLSRAQSLLTDSGREAFDGRCIVPRARMLDMVFKHPAGSGTPAALDSTGKGALHQLSLRSLSQAARLQWSWSHTSSILIGTAIAWKDGFFDPLLLLLTWFVVEMIHA